MTVLKFRLPAKDVRNAESENAEADTHHQSHRAEVAFLMEKFPEAFRMENAVIQRLVTDALTHISETKAAQLSRYFGLDGSPAEQSADEALASQAVLDALQEVDPKTTPGSTEMLQRLHVIAGRIASVTEADPDALRALWKAPPKNRGQRNLVSSTAAENRGRNLEVEFV